MITSPREVQVGRRVRKMLDKQSRIFDAASSLFADRGFESVTTQQISDQAEIAAGTLFRYASSKGELLMMVYNAEFLAALEAGERIARLQTDPLESVVALVRPTLEAAADSVENTVAYQRELLFGSPVEKYRADGLALVARLEADIAERLVTAAAAREIDSPQVAEQARLAGRSVFAVLHLALAQPATGAHPGHDAAADLRGQIALIIAGFFAALASTPDRRFPA